LLKFCGTNLFALFLSSASANGATNETENANSIGGGRQLTARGRGRGRARGRGRSRTTGGRLAQWFGI
jgi:hypothetical protein